MHSHVLLNELLAELDGASCDDAAQFHALVRKSVVVLDLTDAAVAALLNMNRTTVFRWRAGRNAPSPVMRAMVFMTFERLVRERLLASREKATDLLTRVAEESKKS
jgi:hypothetical protein